MKKGARISKGFQSLTEAHRVLGLPEPLHPLVSVLNSRIGHPNLDRMPHPHVLNFYKISYKPKLSGKFRYGQGYYDFDGGGLLFAAPNQVIGVGAGLEESSCSDYTLFIHPDFLWGYPIAKKIKQYGFFCYSTNEALHLSEAEKERIFSVFHIIEEELNNRIDDFSQDVIISQIELLLNYANRFYKRQFITRKAASSELLERLTEILDRYFTEKRTLTTGIPTVHYLAECLNVSSSYLSDMLRSLTGQNAQQHIHQKLIEFAKEKLATTNLTISEVAYELGFEHPQSFSKLFKTKTQTSPLAFRQSFGAN